MNKERKVVLVAGLFAAGIATLIRFQWRTAQACERRRGYTVGRMFHFTPACVQPR